MKKKGLIISTVVMVVVLIASLTTATYAWFQTSAKATVDDLTITTEAATGLQIAMTGTAGSTATLYSGELKYENGWTGAVDGWGTYLGFAEVEVGKLEHAVTTKAIGDQVPIFVGYKALSASTLGKTVDYYKATKVETTAGVTDVKGKYVLDGGIYKVTSDTSAQEGTEYYTIAKTDDSVTASNATSYLMVATETKTIGTDDGYEAGYYQAVAYDSATQPIGYKKVVENQNGTYYKLTMAVTNIKQVAQLGFSIEVIPSGTTNIASPSSAVDATNNPGMAAATRINIEVAKANQSGGVDSWEKSELQPFEAWKLNTTTKAIAKDTGSSNKNDSGRYTYALASNVAENEVFFVTMYIWVEGTDNECNNITTGTAMQFKINFVYAETGALGANDWGFEGNAGTVTAIKSFNN